MSSPVNRGKESWTANFTENSADKWSGVNGIIYRKI